MNRIKEFIRKRFWYFKILRRSGYLMGINELKVLQEDAFKVYTKFHEVDLSKEIEVLEFLTELHPYLTNVNVNLPKEQFFNLLKRNGYGENLYLEKTDCPIQKQIKNILTDVKIEELIYESSMKHFYPSHRYVH